MCRAVPACEFFFSFFVKSDVLLAVKRSKDLMQLNFKEENLSRKELIHIGLRVTRILKKNPNSFVVQNILKATLEAYLMRGKYILKKLSLNNEVLRKFSCINSAIVTTPSTAILKTYLSCPSLVRNATPDEQNDGLGCFLAMGSYLVMCKPMETMFIVCSGGWRSVNSILCYSKWLHNFFLISTLQK